MTKFEKISKKRVFDGLPSPEHGIKVMTYNTLTQTMINPVRYPTNGKARIAGIRIGAIKREILFHNPDILYLQEVDGKCMSDWSHFLHTYGWDSYNFFFPKKLHGILIAWKKNKFLAWENSKTVFKNDTRLPVQDVKSTHCGLTIALKCKRHNHTFIVATTHLTWRPQQCYERSRQFLIMMSDIERMKKRWNTDMVIFGGDFNTVPDAPLYQYVASDNYIDESSVETLQKSVEAGFETESDHATVVDSIIEFSGNIETKLKSCYAAILGKEPEFTNWTDTFRATLSYIFVSDAFNVDAVSVTPTSDDLGPEPNSLPRIIEDVIYPSDHIPLVAWLSPRHLVDKTKAPEDASEKPSEKLVDALKCVHIDS